MQRYSLLITLCIFSVLATAQSHWESIIVAENTWSYLEGNSEPDAEWNTLSFDDNSWKQGAGGLGYNDNDDATQVEAVASLYLRKTFQVSDLSQVEKLLLDIDYDDGFVAYLNGFEVARSSNVTAVPPAYNSGTSIDREALMYNGGTPEQYQLDLSKLTVGENILAIQILNISATSSDLSALAYLHAKINSNSTLYQPIPSWFVEPLSYESSNLPIIKITTDNQTILDDPKITAHMGIINNGEGQINLMTDTFTDYDGYIGIEMRGQSSQYFFPKKSYGFETRDAMGENLNVKLLGMPKENDWVLYAPYSDKSMMRNAITFELAKSLDTYSSRTAFCELYIDDVYQGIYILMEKVKRDDSRVDVDSLISINEDQNSITGGYIFKVDKKDADYVNVLSGWTTYPNPSYPNAMDITYQYVYPKAEDLKNTEYTYIKDYVTTAEEVLISSDFANKETGYNRYFNLGSFVDFMLINEVSKEVDKYRYSTYFHKKKDSKGGEIYAGPIWDFNLGYGNVDYWADGLETSGWLFSDVKNVDYSIMFWWKRLMEDPYFESIATERYHSLRSKEWSDKQVIYLIDSIASHIDEAQARNYVRWPILGTYVWPNYLWANMTYADEVQSFKTWILNRLAWMDDNLSGTVLSPEATLSYSDQSFPNTELSLDIELKEVYFNHSQLKNKYFEIKGDDGLLEVDSVIYIDAMNATVLISSGNNALGNNDISVKIDDNILTTFDNITSNSINLAASISDTEAQNSLKIYTTSKSITIECDRAELLGSTLKIYNIQGQRLLTYTLNNNHKQSYELNLPEGVYLTHCTYANSAYTQKIILR